MLEHIHVTFEGKAKWFWSETCYIELIALYIMCTQKIAIIFDHIHEPECMALDHSRLGLENKFLENKSGQIFCCQQVYTFQTLTNKSGDV